METSTILNLPCLRGAIGTWIYYTVVIPFTELYRIDTDHKIKEDKELDKWLQRGLGDRVDNIKDYLLNENERFFNTIIVGVYGGNPDWYSLDLTVLNEMYQINISERVSESLGVLSLSGKEILFTVDGQHRVEAIKRALQIEPDRFKSDELSLIFIAHKENEPGYVKTRKFFATINREAKQPNDNDLAIIDETYAYNIIARMVYARYTKFKGLIKLTENASMDRDEHEYFTNLLNLVAVNKKLYKLYNYRDNKFTSPTYDQREKFYKITSEFYDFIANNISQYSDYFSNKKKLSDFRNSEKGKPLSLLFMPIGISLLAQVYVHFYKKNKLNVLKGKINGINYDLYEGHFKDIYFSPVKNNIITSNDVIGRRLALHLLGEPNGLTTEDFKKKLAKAYNINELSDEFKTLKVPLPL